MPLEPLFSIDVACELIPITRANLGNILFKFKDQFDTPRYDTLSQNHPRMLTERECLLIRNIVIQTPRRGMGTRFASVLRSKQARNQAFWKAVDPFLLEESTSG